MEMAAFQYIILMTLFHSHVLRRHAKLCFANTECTTLQLEVRKSSSVFWFMIGLCWGFRVRVLTDVLCVCIKGRDAPFQMQITQGSTIPEKFPLFIIPIERWNRTTNARFEWLNPKALMEMLMQTSSSIKIRCLWKFSVLIVLSILRMVGYVCLNDEGGRCHSKDCFYWLLKGKRHIKP